MSIVCLQKYFAKFLHIIEDDMIDILCINKISINDTTQLAMEAFMIQLEIMLKILQV